MAKNALHSLFGSKARAASADRVRDLLRDAYMEEPDEGLLFDILEAVKPTKALTGCVGGQQREQTVLTPSWLIEQLGPIGLDPCTTPDNPVGAEIFYTEGMDGLRGTWQLTFPGLVYVNPPFNDLERWLEKAWVEASKSAKTKIVLLGPIRTNRTWWCDFAETADQVAVLRPFKFVGHESAFPAPLCMMSWNMQVPDLMHPATARLPARPLITGWYRR